MTDRVLHDYIKPGRAWAQKGFQGRGLFEVGYRKER